jgi:hypothetical protein
MTQPTAISSPSEGQIPQTCRHHWVIQPAAAPLSPGVCQTCGELREFKNFVETSSWFDWGLSIGSRAESSAVAAKSVVIYMEDHEEE